jgi:hypothetical protein
MRSSIIRTGIMIFVIGTLTVGLVVAIYLLVTQRLHFFTL